MSQCNANAYKYSKYYILHSHFHFYKKLVFCTIHTSHIEHCISLSWLHNIFRGRKKETIEYGFLSVHFTLAYCIVFFGDVWYLGQGRKRLLKTANFSNLWLFLSLAGLMRWRWMLFLIISYIFNIFSYVKIIEVSLLFSQSDKSLHGELFYLPSLPYLFYLHYSVSFPISQTHNIFTYNLNSFR